jgi:hypothetical protein
MEVWMRMFRMTVVALLVALTAFPSLASAQQRHAVSPATMAAAVADHAAQQDADRETIRQALSRPEVREIADNTGIDMARVTAAVNTMSGADLDRAADIARQVNDSLVGGASTVVISTTTIIIILLIVILIVVAVD